ncbi:hypothetical protein LINPERHAP1_LOCUS2634, partial [Linum perenne]
RTPSSGYTPPYGYNSRSQSGFQSSVELKCRHCGEAGHAISVCRKRNFCNYCKKPGHIIVDCRKRAFRNNNGQQSSYTPSGVGSQFLSSSRSTAYSTSSAAPSEVSSISPVSVQPMDIHTMVQQAIQQALPTALNAAFATFGTAGSEERETDRSG